MDIKPLNVLGAEVSDVDLISLSSKGSVKGSKMRLMNTRSFSSEIRISRGKS